MGYGGRMKNKREREKLVVSEMIALYCKKHHGGKSESLCSECAQVLAYAHERSDKCPHMENKTFCSVCKTHCYNSDMREKIRMIMRYSGPRMMTVHPVLSIRHLLETKAQKRQIRKNDASNK